MKKTLLILFFICGSFLYINAQDIKAPDTVSATKTFDKVEVEAEFPGGGSAWRDFLGKKLDPNVPVKNDAPIGKYRVIVLFIVNKDGTISDIEPLTKHGYGMEEEVIKIIKSGPKWQPAMQNGKPVRAYRKQPITFSVDHDDIDIRSKTPYTFFVGTDNIVTIDIKKLDNEDIDVTISQGSIIYKGGNKYIVKVNTPGIAVIEMNNLKKKGKKIAAASFQVNANP